MKKDFMTLMKAKTADVRPSVLSAEEAIKSQIVVLEPLRNLIPALTAEEQQQLEQNILTHGVKDPLTIWETTAGIAGLGSDDSPAFVLVDGHNRYRIIQQHKLDFRINLVRFASLEEIRDYMIDYQLGRRNLTPEQASYLRGLRYNQQKAFRGSNLQTGIPQINVAEKLATEYGVSSRTIKRDGEFAAGVEKLTSELKQEVLTGKTKLSKAALASLAKPETIDSEPVSAAPSPQASLPRENELERLQQDIRKLANGRLDKRSCSQLLQKVTELLQLKSSK